jgi:hypothetical protein
MEKGGEGGQWLNSPAAPPYASRQGGVAAASYGLNDRLVAIADGLAHFGHSMCKHLVGHDYVRPDRLHRFVLGYNAVVGALK